MIARIKNIRTVALFASLCRGALVGMSGGALMAEVLYDHTTDGFRSAIAIGSDYLSTPGLQRLLSSGDKCTVCFVSGFARREDAQLMIAGKGRTEVTYSDWLRMYRADTRREAFQMKRIIRIAEDSAMQSVDRGVVSRVVLSGSDPTQFSVGRYHCELLELHWHRLARPIRPDGLNPLTVVAFVRSDLFPSDADATAIYRQIRSRLISPEIELLLTLRTDVWFIEDSEFPLWFPFVAEQPPTFKEYRSRGSVFCVNEPAGIRCHGASGN